MSKIKLLKLIVHPGTAGYQVWLLLICSLTASPVRCSTVEDHANEQPMVASISTAAGETAQVSSNSSLRWTKNGWEDSSIWTVKQTSHPSAIRSIHPLLLTLSIVLLILICLTMTSRPDEIDHLVAELSAMLGENFRGKRVE